MTRPPRDEQSPPRAGEIGVRPLIDALIAGDRNGVAQVVNDALVAGMAPPELLLGVLAPALRAVGEGWHRGELSIAQEHWATEAVLEEMARVRRERRPRRSLGVSAVVAVIEGEVHLLPARLVATVLEWRGWRVDLLGGGMPADELARYVRVRGPDVVALSVTMEDRLAAAKEAIVRMDELDPRPIVAVGGAACSTLEEPDRLGADVVATDLLEGVARLESLLGAPRAREDVAEVLGRVGARVRAARHRLELSQSEVAARASLTRPYLSAVENGGQNVSLETLVHLAGALETSVVELLRDDGGTA